MPRPSESVPSRAAADVLPIAPLPRLGPGALASLTRTTLAVLLLLRLGSVFADRGMTGVFVNIQDRWLLLLGLALAGLALAGRKAASRPITLPAWSVWVLALLVLAAGYLGHYAVLAGYDLSRDEQMAVFDSRILAAGRPAWPLPPAWQGQAEALNLMFMLPVAHPVAWVSNYLPGNAGLRALVGLIADPALTGPLLSGFAVLALWRCARLLWPVRGPLDGEAIAIAVLMLALSGQVVVTAMTAYAMPAHLAANLLWLWLFLRNRRASDGGALAVGFLATGLHQPLPHPMFVAPFLALMAARREWRRLALFVAVYAAIGLFWLAWPYHVHALVTGPGSTTVGNSTGFVGRLLVILGDNAQPLPLMAANLLRFATWQAVPMVPLLLAGFAVARRGGVPAALAGGILLPILIQTAILAYQGHGFGYRYLHGVIGNAALLAGYGWRSLAPWHERLRPALRRALGLSALVLLPVQMAMAHQLYAPYAEASRRIDRSGADYAIVSTWDAPFSADLVLNRPDLSNRPLRLIAEAAGDPRALAGRLCHPGTRVVLLGTQATAPIWAWFRARPEADMIAAHRALVSDVFTRASCTVVTP